MTLHFVAPHWKTKANVPLCQQQALSPRWGKTTEDKNEVSCKRCAKSLGIEPATKVEKGSPTGTCQCCFGAFKLPRGKGKLSHHGYKRPGYGYDVGYCMGEGQLPYEKSCEVTRALMHRVSNYLEHRREYLSKLESGTVERLIVSMTDYSQPLPRGEWKRPTKAVVVTKGDEEVYSYDGRIGNVLPSFENALKREIQKVGYDIRAAEEQEKFLAQKVAEWKLVD